VIRLNLGAGAYPIRDGPAVGQGWVNVDEDPETPADRHYHVPPIPYQDGAVAEIFAGHLLEHFEPQEADRFLQDCRRVLEPGGRLGVVVPDTRAVLARYLEQRHTWVEVPAGQQWNLDDLDAVCAAFLFSTIQPSRHKWAYDGATLRRALVRNGFLLGGPIPDGDPRIAVPAWWNLSVQATRPVVLPEVVG
jgi:predicted SAM-dependent methyltransferase